MDPTSLEGIESLRVMSAAGHLTIAGIEDSTLRISTDPEPDLRRSGATAEIHFAGHAEIGVPAGVAVEVVDCAGHLEVEDFAGNLSLHRVGGHFSANNVGAIAVRGNLEGRCFVENAGAISGRCVKGDLFVEKAKAVSFDLVACNATCLEIAGDVSIEQIGGRCEVEEAGGAVRAITVGGKLEVERVQSLSVETVGGKLRAIKVAGDLAAETVGGKVSIDGAGSVRIGTVGGHASLRAISGDVAIAQVGGAARISGEFARGSKWRLKSGGRILVEMKNNSSVELDALARHGRVRVYGMEGQLRFNGRERLAATFGAGECKLSLETAGSDIIVEGEEARGRAGAGAGLRWRDLGAPFESFAGNLGTEIPEMVAGIVGAAGRIVAETGSLSGGLVRGVTRGVTDAMREVERELGDLKREVPEEAAERLSRLGARIRELVEQAIAERRSRSHADAERIRERIREETRRMREAVREARRNRRSGFAEEAAENETAAAAPTPAEQPQPASPEPIEGATKPLVPEQEILRILASVRAGEIDPEEADDLIRALMEVERAEGETKSEAH